MKNIFISLSIILLSFTLLNAQDGKFIPGMVIVKYSNEKAANNRESDFAYLCNTKAKRAARMFATPKHDKPSADISRIYRIEYEGNASPAVVARKLAQSEDVEYAQPYWIPELLDAPNDPRLGSQYYMQITKALESYQLTKGDTDIVIGIIDTGVDIYHEDLADNIKINYADPINGIDDDNDGYIDNYRGWDIACNDNNPISTVNHHGTYVAGVAVASTNNGIGIAGIGYNTKFMPIKASEDTEGLLTACYEGIVYAADHGCKIINCSWGNSRKNPLCDDVIKYAQSKGCLVVAAAGNTGTDVRYYPASCDGAVSVAGTNANDAKWAKSTYNNRVDISAPGENIYTTNYDNKYLSGGNGTSYASPIVAAAAALVWAHRPELTATQVAELLRVTADNIDTIPGNAPFIGKIGSGRINILKALTDSTSPSVRITDYAFLSKSDEMISGSEITIDIDVCNHLYPTSDIKVTVESPDNSATIADAAWKIDSLGTNGTASHTFTATLADTLSADRIVQFLFRFETGNYSARQTIELTVNPSFKDIKWGDTETTIANNGKIGIYNYDAQYGNGFLFKKQYNLISDGALIVALDEQTIASAFQNDDQFICTCGNTLTDENGVTHIKSTIEPINIEGISIQQDFIFDSKNLPSAMVCDYTIVNSGDYDYSNAAVGLYFDWDVVNSTQNVIDYDASRQLAYIYNTGTEGIHGGICLLTKGNAVPYAFELSEYGGSIDITNGFTDEQKWETMNNARPKSTSRNIDLALMLSLNRMKLHIGDTAEIKFAILAGENIHEIDVAADLAKELYCTEDEPAYQIEDTETRLSVFPNPAKSTITVMQPATISRINIYNASGTLELTQGVDSHQATISTERLAEGCHIVEIVSSDGQTSRRLVIK